MSEAMKEAAAAVAFDMSAELVEKIPVGPSDVDVLAQDVSAVAGVVAEPVVPSQPQTVQPAQEQPVASEPYVVPTFEPQLDDDYRELLEEPDFEAEAAAEVQENYDDPSEDGYVDPEAARKIRELEKRNQWLEQQNIRASKPRWVQEAAKNFPDLARYAPDELKGIQADSRRAFAREAARLNDRFARFAKPIIDEIAASSQVVHQETRQQAVAEVQAAYGTPTVGPPLAAVTGSEALTELEAARKTGQLHKVIGVLLKQGR